MDIGFKISLLVGGVMMVLLFTILIPFFKKHIVREKGKINYAKTTIYLR